MNTKIALLSTGDELVTGDILNTNGQKISQTLFENGFELGLQITVSDDESEIVEALNFLRQQHSIIITTGGLGPTSDDRTRFALAKATQRQLEFHQPSWEAIENRLKKYRFKIHPTNRQQAMFPENSFVIENPHGTAAGCRLNDREQLFFMLPGPPSECLPMFQNHVLPYLQKHKLAQKFIQNKWRLFGVSEGEIAAELDAIADGYPVKTGYRWAYPYLEFKLLYQQNFDVTPLLKQLEPRLSEISICSTDQTALEAFINQAANIEEPLLLHDQATRGLLQYHLSAKHLSSHIQFVEKNQAKIFLNGLDALWETDSDASHTQLIITGNYQKNRIEEIKQIPFRSRQVTDYAIEYIAYCLSKLINAKV